MSTIITNKLNLHSEFNTLLKNKVKPIIILEFIYKNVYELIDEIPFISDILGEELKKNYNLYFSSVIENWEEEYLLTLFPNPDLSKYFSFKKIYIGITGRLVFFSQKNRVYYWYGDPRAWDISYIFVLTNPNWKSYWNCQFILLENYSQFQIAEALGSGFWVNNKYVIYKIKFDNNNFNILDRTEETCCYMSYNKEFKKIIKDYIANYKKDFNQEINEYAIKTWFELFEDELDYFDVKIKNSLK